MGNKNFTIFHFILGGIICILLIILFKPENQIKNLNVRSEYSNCIANNNEDGLRGVCLKDLAVKIIGKIPIQKIESDLSVLSPIENNWCHEFMHYAGWKAYDIEKNLPEAFLMAGNICDSGMHHGIVEEFVNQISIKYGKEDFLPYVKNACETGWKRTDVVGGEKNLCNHGLGHGFMIVSKNKLGNALSACDTLNRDAKISCYTGVFMESTKTKRIGNNSSSLFIANKNPDAPCNDLHSDHKTICYRYIGSTSNLENNGTNENTFKRCGLVDPKYQNSCYWGIGSNTPHPGMKLEEIADQCLTGLNISPIAYSECIRGSVSFISQKNLGRPEHLVEYCSYIETDFKNICYEEAGATIADWSSSDDEFKNRCNEFKSVDAISICQSKGLKFNKK